MIDTISYSPGARGWSSRYTWYPDWHIGMNSTYYSFKNGNLYKHNANANYNEFYGNSTAEVTSGTDTSGTAGKLTDSTATFNNGSILVDDYVVNHTTGGYAIVTAIDSATVLSISGGAFSSGDSYEISRNQTSVTFPFNDSPDEEKVFKTLSIDSNVPWIVDVSTDLANGNIDDSYFSLKEGEYHAWIRRDSEDLDLENLSVQGIGPVLTYSAGPPIEITFGTGAPLNITTPVSNGDQLYRVDATGNGIELIGNVTAHTTTTITVDAAAVTPTTADFILVAKDSTAESRGARGSYMLTEMKIYKDTASELFGVGSEVFKSHP